MQKQRGCFKPGVSIHGKSAFRFVSPYIPVKEQVIHECPMGLVLREAPWAWRAISVHSMCGEQGPGLGFLELPIWMQNALSIISSERARYRTQSIEGDKAKSDADYGRRLRQRGS